MRRQALAALLGFLVVAAPVRARAQEIAEPPGEPELIVVPQEDGSLVTATSVVVSAPARSDKPLFGTLYGSFATLQVLDVVATYQAHRAGGTEANPLMKGISGNTVALVAVKAGATAGTIWLTDRLRRKHRVAAIVAMVGFNSAYAIIVAKNFHNLR